MGNSQRLGSSVRAALAAAAITTSMGLMAVVAPAATAQEASPVPAECVAPALPPGTPTPMDMASPEAMGEMDMMPMASPEAEVERAGNPADEAVTAEAQAAAQNIAACVNSGNFEGVAALLTSDMMMADFGTDNPYDVAAMMGGFGLAFEGFTTGAVYVYDDGAVSVDVQYNQGPYQVVAERWYLVQEDGYWKLDGFDAAAPMVEGDTTVVGVSLTDYAFTFNVSSVVQPEVLQFQVRNDGAEMHELILVRMPEGAETAEDVTAMLADDPEGSFLQESFIAAVFLEPGEQTDMVLVGLEPGKYVAICFIPTADGTPHFEEGMIAEFEVIGL